MVKRAIWVILLLLGVTSQLSAQENLITIYPESNVVTEPPRNAKIMARQIHRDSMRANKKVWTSVLGGSISNVLVFTPSSQFIR